MTHGGILLALACAVGPGVAAAAVSADTAASDWTILPRTEADQAFHSNGVPAHLAGGGFALTSSQGHWRLVPASVSRRLDPQDAPDVVALAATPPDALAYLRLPGLAAGPVDTPGLRFQGAAPSLARPSLAVPFKRTPWRFETRAGKLSLTDGTRRQALGDASDPATDRVVTLLWAGDLDHDGKLDFLVDDAYDDAARLCIWLSSRAVPGALVGQAACVEHDL